LVLHRPFVEGSVVLHWTQLPILFLDEEEGRGIGGDGGSNVSLRQLFVQEVVEGFIFGSCHGVYLAIDGFGGIVLEGDRMILRSGWWKVLGFFLTEH
jgi:hypothetical protein